VVGGVPRVGLGPAVKMKELVPYTILLFVAPLFWLFYQIVLLYPEMLL
jgi:hypothetical protein